MASSGTLFAWPLENRLTDVCGRHRDALFDGADSDGVHAACRELNSGVPSGVIRPRTSDNSSGSLALAL